MPVTRGQLKRMHDKSTEHMAEKSTKSRKRANQQVANSDEVAGDVHRLFRPTIGNIDGYSYGSVNQMTIHNDELFMVKWPTSSHIEVYGMTDFKFRRDIQVDGLGYRSGGLAPCATNNCLYVTDLQRSIYRVELISGSYKTIMWKLDYKPFGPSVNRQHNLLVAGMMNHQMQGAILEYTTDGQLVREIILSEDIVYPLHAVQLNDNQFLVGHTVMDCSFGNLCVVDANGQVQISYKPGQGHLTMPKRSVVDKNGFIYTVDISTGKIVVLTGELKWSRDLRLDGILHRPIDMCWLNDSRDRLLVVEADRIAVLNLQH